MTTKQKIWSIPLITMLIFSIGMAVTYKFSSTTYQLLHKTSITFYPYMHSIQVMSRTLKGIQENFLDAIDINGKSGISMARHKAQEFRKTAFVLATIEGKERISKQILDEFERYYVPAENAASIMAGITPGNAYPDFEKMIVTLNTLTATLMNEDAEASKAFSNSLQESRSNVLKMLWVVLLTVIFVLLSLIYTSKRLINFILINLENLRNGAKKIEQGDFTARIPEQGKDELALVAQSFNSMNRELQNATEKRLQYELALKTLNAELEDRVVKRTTELGVALEEANKANAAVAYMADHDSLTGILNRRRFQNELERWTKHALRYDRPLTLMFIDLDKFKIINDTHGHLGGDEYLLEFTRLLKPVLRSTDYLGRWGGDEFAVLLPETNALTACEVANKLTNFFAEEKISVAGHSIHVSASIGIASLPEHASLTNELMAYADAAMYKAKEAGCGCFFLYSASEQEVKHMGEQSHWAGRIRRALDADQFILHYQPLLDLKTGGTLEYEALLRLEDSKGEFISPNLFLASAERFDLSIAIDRMVIKKTAHKIASLRKAQSNLRLSINLSSQSLDDARIVTYIHDTIKEFDIDPSHLAIEISEAAILRNINRVRNLSAEVAHLGSRLILDNIGVGFSSFHYLAPLSIYSIKIRGDLIQNLHIETNREYVKKLCRSCHDLNIKVVAKSVENLSMLDTLRDTGIDFAQGFAVSAPLESLDTFDSIT